MAENLKEKFMNLLFEPEEKEVVQEVINKEIKEEIKEETQAKPVEQPKTEIKASDVLYHKSVSSAFINLDEPRRTRLNSNSSYGMEYDNENIKDVDFELNAQISPMFGLIKTNDSNKKVVQPEDIDKVTKKPENDHLEIIPSPIYGYGKQEDVPEVNNAISETQELTDLFKDEEEEKYTVNQEDLEKEISLFDIFGDK